MKNPDITILELRRMVRLDRDSGRLFWLERSEEMFPSAHAAASWNTKFSGREAFAAVTRKGYRVGVIKNIRVAAHRVVFALVNGFWSDCPIDHINGDPSDNRPCNIRAVTYGQNNRNLGIRRANKSGVTGVHWCSRRAAWVAQISDGKRHIFLGRFATIAAAQAARKAAELEYDYHPNHGRRQNMKGSRQ